MRGMEDESVDLIYLDPPFNSKHDYSAPIGSDASGATFKDTWTLDDVDVEWWGEIADLYPALYKVLEATRETAGKSMMSYLIYMAVRIIEMRRILKPAGSLYLHCDPTASHYLKLALDTVFGAARHNNEIVWKRTGSHNSAKRWGPTHDTIFYYSKGESKTWNRVLQPYSKEYLDSSYRYNDERGRYRLTELTGPGTRTGDSGQPWRRIDFTSRGRHWAVPLQNALPEWFNYPEQWSRMSVQERLDVLDEQGLVDWGKDGKSLPRFKRYLLDGSGVPLQDTITDILPISGHEDLGYPTQKPLALLERIIMASSNEGDVVLDPFCGCATACSAAEKQNRQWIGIDMSPKAYDLVKVRLQKEAGLDKFTKGAGEVIHRTDIPQISGVRTRNIKHVLYGVQEGRCKGCRGHYNFKDFEVDHITPRAKGGQDVDENLQLLCGHCNRVKGGKLTMAELKARLKEIGVSTDEAAP